MHGYFFHYFKWLTFIVQIFLPLHMAHPDHWFLVVVNTTIQYIQILNSLNHKIMETDESRTYLENTVSYYI